MVQAFEADNGDGVPVNQHESARASLIGEVLDFVKENPTVSTIAAISVTAGSIYLARAPIARVLSKFGGAAVAAEETAVIAGKLSKPLGRQLAVSGDDAIVSGVKVEEAIVGSTGATQGSTRPLLNALDDAVKTGKAKTPEPWVYLPENRGILKDLPKGGATDIKPAAETVESVGTIGSTHSPDAADIFRIAFPNSTKPPLIDVNKHRFLRGK